MNASPLPTRPAPTAPGARALLEALRPLQWGKNVFVLAGVVFAGRLFDAPAALRAAAAFAVFSAAASSVYLANDLADREVDAHHPRKRLRPIASGRLAPGAAAVAAIALACAALAGAWALGPATCAIVGAYLATSLAYSWGLKRAFLLDVMVVALGFVLRAAAGAAAVRAEISPWLLVCTFLLALFLALGKRRAELGLLGDDADRHRAGLSRYSAALVDNWLTALSGATIVCYALYTQSPRTVAHFGGTRLVYTVPFVVYALFRYQALVLEGAGGEPGALVVRDRGLLVAVLGWAVAAGAAIYL